MTPEVPTCVGLAAIQTHARLAQDMRVWPQVGRYVRMQIDPSSLWLCGIMRALV